MLCTSHETMCPWCKHHFKALRETAVSAADLEYTPNTFPVVFTCTQKIPVPVRRGTLMQAVYEQRGRTVTELKERLANHFHRPVNVYDDFDEGEFRYHEPVIVYKHFEHGEFRHGEPVKVNSHFDDGELGYGEPVNEYNRIVHGEFWFGEKTTVTYKILVDFPGVIANPNGWASWISQSMCSIKFYELVVRSDGGKNACPKAIVKPEEYQWDGCVPENKGHLCWTRLEFFLERQGLVPFI